MVRDQRRPKIWSLWKPWAISLSPSTWVLKKKRVNCWENFEWFCMNLDGWPLQRIYTGTKGLVVKQASCKAGFKWLLEIEIVNDASWPLVWIYIYIYVDRYIYIYILIDTYLHCYPSLGFLWTNQDKRSANLKLFSLFLLFLFFCCCCCCSYCCYHSHWIFQNSECIWLTKTNSRVVLITPFDDISSQLVVLSSIYIYYLRAHWGPAFPWESIETHNQNAMLTSQNPGSPLEGTFCYATNMAL